MLVAVFVAGGGLFTQAVLASTETVKLTASDAVPSGCEGAATGDVNWDGRVRWAVLGDSYQAGEGLIEPRSR